LENTKNNNMDPLYNLDKIKFATDRPTFEKAVGLYEAGKITEFSENTFGFSAVVLGGNPYQVYVSAKNYDSGSCECYLGQNDTLCKHMVAVAIYAVMKGKQLKEDDKLSAPSPACSGCLGELSAKELSEVKATIASAMRHIKSYNGPSRIWFAYQASLSEGCHRLTAVISKLPVSVQTAKLIVDLLLRLDKKLCTGGVDDSDGAVGGFMEETVQVLEQFALLDHDCIKIFVKLAGLQTCFGWEEPLVRLVDES
jgi:hypothetical protein